MGFYDNFWKSNTASVSKIGKKIIAFQNSFFLNLIRKHSKNKSNISLLEIGPGKGFFAEYCKKNGIKNYAAIEQNKSMANSLKNKGFKVYCQRVPPIKVKSKFDIIFMNQVFEHMKDLDEAISLLQSCRKKLNKGGLLMIASPEINFWKEHFYSDYTHCYETSLERLNQMFFDYDLEVLYKNYYTFFVRGYFLTKIISSLALAFYNLGIFKIIFRKKNFKVKNSLLGSFVIVGKKND